MADINDLLSDIEALATDSGPPLSLPEKVQGYARSYLAGPTFNYEDELEGLARSLFTGRSYDEEVSDIRQQQQRFKDKTEYLDNAVELASGAVLNPLSSLGKARAVSGPLVSTLKSLFTSAPAQAALASAGAAKEGDRLSQAALGGAVGTAGSVIGSVFGKVLSDSTREADRLKLSAYGIGAAPIAKQLRELGDGASKLESASNIPILKSLQRAEQEGVIDAGNDLLTNANNLFKEQEKTAKNLSRALGTLDEKLAPSPEFKTSITKRYIESLTGSAREKAQAAADKEIAALSTQIGAGSLRDLQRLKIGLNYKFDENPYGESVVKTLRSDLRAEIERRAKAAASEGIVDPSLAKSIKTLNARWGSFDDLREALVRRGYKDIQGDIVEDAFRGGATTGGVGTANIASATTGNPIYSILGMAANAARVPEAKSQLGNILLDPAVNKPLSAIGDALPEIMTGRNVAQAYTMSNDKDPQKSELSEMRGLISDIEKLVNEGRNSSEQLKDSRVEMKPISDVEKEIDADPYLSAVYEIESGRNPAAKNPTSSAKGGFQLIDSTAKALGVNDPMDLEQALLGAKRLTDEHKAKFGDNPILLYAAHYLGAPTLSKVINRKPLSDAEKTQVQFLRSTVLPRFQKVYFEKLLQTLEA